LKRHEESGAEGDARLLPHIRLHDVRHTYATLGALDGIPPKIMAERLGQDVITYMATYGHNLPGMQESAAELLEARLDGV
jgi:integrase